MRHDRPPADCYGIFGPDINRHPGPCREGPPGTTAPTTRSRHCRSGPRAPYVLPTAREPPALRGAALANHHDPV